MCCSTQKAAIVDPIGSIIFAAILALITGGLASRKGYNFFAWFLSGGLVGLVALAFLADVRPPETENRAEKLKRGNIIGALISVIAIVAVIALNLGGG